MQKASLHHVAISFWALSQYFGRAFRTKNVFFFFLFWMVFCLTNTVARDQRSLVAANMFSSRIIHFYGNDGEFSMGKSATMLFELGFILHEM